jgi:hypothetical protein
MALKPLALCADDYALTPAVSAGIVAAAAAGRITATSAMVTRPHWPAAAAALAPVADRIDVGLHLNLTLGPPLSAATRLAPGGLLPAARRLAMAAFTGALPADEVRAEIAAQLDAFAAAMGRPPDYVDGHWHVHALPGIRGALLAELAARDFKGWLRDPADRPGRILQRGVQAAKAAAVSAMTAGFGQAARSAGFGANDSFAGFSAFEPARDYGADFARFLQASGAAPLIMCHPGHVDAELAAVDDAVASREVELRFLLSERLPALLEAGGLRLARLSETLAGRSPR